ncbi:hypothetical protein [Kineosporia sp. NBRC 101731]|uniref:hypothetical protein n=1 Tax=Kineosporia sp. NBRC 101731 TaxID=3032199 RepID=UPI0024A0491A|nr:hypothetical protein [Kineosporia sp. NBRC 101731]GLY32146.1 hypothetical protein Kisp02_55110 [Kineosporia sp. NBRC 101731]
MNSVFVLATSATSSSVEGVTSSFLGQGILGAIGLVALGVFWTAWRRESARADSERAAKDELVKELLAKVVPLLTEATRTQQEFLEQVRRDR